MQYMCTVAIFTRNAESTLKHTLQILAKQTVQPIHILIIDNASSDKTLEIARLADTEVIHIGENDFDHGEVRDKAATQALGEIIVFLVGDAVPVGQEWLQNLITPFSSPSVAMVQGLEDLYTKYYFWERRYLGMLWKTRDHFRWRQRYGFGASHVCAAYRAALLREKPIGKFLVCEDKEYQRRLSDLGWRCVVAPDVIVRHNHTYGWSELHHRLVLIGYGMKLVGARYGWLDLIIDTSIGVIVLVLFLPWLVYRHICGLISGRKLQWTEWIFPIVQPILVFFGHRMSQEDAWLEHLKYQKLK